jgi:hypothetical protein
MTDLENGERVTFVTVRGDRKRHDLTDGVFRETMASETGIIESVRIEIGKEIVTVPLRFVAKERGTFEFNEELEEHFMKTIPTLSFDRSEVLEKKETKKGKNTKQNPSEKKKKVKGKRKGEGEGEGEGEEEMAARVKDDGKEKERSGALAVKADEPRPPSEEQSVQAPVKEAASE